MAVTKGQGNPKWTREETVLALDLYFSLDGKIPSSNDGKIVELSNLLRSSPIHPLEVRKESFRNPDGVGFKLQNIRNVATGKGLDNTSEMDKSVWAEFRTQRELVRKLAERIRSGIRIIGPGAEIDNEVEDDETFYEGKIISVLHRRRERSPGLRKKVITARKIKKQINCDICGTTSFWSEQVDEAGMFECHHVIPLAEGEARSTRVEDIALLCASCHRMIHVLIAKNKSWITIEESKKYLRKS